MDKNVHAVIIPFGGELEDLRAALNAFQEIETELDYKGHIVMLPPRHYTILIDRYTLVSSRITEGEMRMFKREKDGAKE